MSGWLNIIKGNYPSLNMVTLDRPVAKIAGSPVLRGSVMVNNNGTFKLIEYNQAKGGVVYWSLNGEVEPEAEYAGTVDAPIVAGLPCTAPMEIETDQFKASDTYTEGSFIVPTVPASGDAATGVVELAGATATEWVIGICTRAPYKRWINNATAIEGQRTGASKTVIRFTTVYIPAMDLSQSSN